MNRAMATNSHNQQRGPVRRTFGILAAVLFLGITMSSCSSDDDPAPTAENTASEARTDAPSDSPTEATRAPTTSPAPSKTEEPEATTPTLEVTITGDKVSPNAQEISIDRGEALTITVVSDRAGELHAHTKPDQYIEFGTGRTEATLTTDVPGVFEIEDHETEAVVAQVEARG